MTEKKKHYYLHSPSFGSLLESSLRRLMYYVGLHVEIHKLTNMTHIRISRFGCPARLDLILQVKHGKTTGIRSSHQLILCANKCSSSFQLHFNKVWHLPWSPCEKKNDFHVESWALVRWQLEIVTYYIMGPTNASSPKKNKASWRDY